jgi:hypothetical protein
MTKVSRSFTRFLYINSGTEPWKGKVHSHTHWNSLLTNHPMNEWYLFGIFSSQIFVFGEYRCVSCLWLYEMCMVAKISTLWARIFRFLWTGMGQSEERTSRVMDGPLIQKLKEPARPHVQNWRLSDFWQEVNKSGQVYRPDRINLMGLIKW